MNKVYTAFISSAFESLRDERNIVIDSLLDLRILPIGMEHFTVSTNGEFSDIEELIDESDFFIMLMGKFYGSCDRNGISWTEREYEYAMEKGKPIVVILCDELVENLNKDKSVLSEDEKRQIEFKEKISFARAVSDEFPIKKIISQFFNSNFAKCIGWTRIENTQLTPEQLEKWRDEHKVFDLRGNWFHVHLSEDDETYIRIGTINIEQDFSPDKYKSFHMEGNNYNIIRYDTQKGAFVENRMKSSHFVGEYTLRENGEIFGIFNSRRTFDSSFSSKEVKRTNRGIHDFNIDVFQKETTFIEGEFHDEAPSPKLGRIFIFRNACDRDEFLLDNRSDVIERK